MSFGALLGVSQIARLRGLSRWTVARRLRDLAKKTEGAVFVVDGSPRIALADFDRLMGLHTWEATAYSAAETSKQLREAEQRIRELEGELAADRKRVDALSEDLRAARRDFQRASAEWFRRGQK